MRSMMWKGILLVAMTAVVFGCAVESASAFWPCGLLGCYGPSYSSCPPGDGDWYVGVRPGPVRRLLFGTYRWYPGCGYSYCSAYPCCDSFCCDSICCTTSSYVVSTTQTPTRAARPATITPAAPTKNPTLTPVSPSVPQDDPAMDAPSSGSTRWNDVGPAPGTYDLNYNMGTTGSATFSVEVPADAKVFINDYETASTGVVRDFTSEGLTYGSEYVYNVRVEIMRNGRILEANRSVVLRAGQMTSLAFSHTDTPTPTAIAAAQ